MDDNTLERFLPALGDRIALRNYCGNSNQAKKQNLLDKLRKKMKLRNPSNTDEDSGEEEDRKTNGKVPLCGNKNACKETRRIEMGWIHNNKQVQTRCGGGTRKLVVKKTAGYEDLIKQGKELFFPGGKSKKGPIENFLFKIFDFQEYEMPCDANIGQLYKSAKLGILRFYLVTVDHEVSEASFEDSESEDAPPEESDDDCYIRTVTPTLPSDDEIQFGPVNDPDYNSEDTLPLNEFDGDISPPDSPQNTRVKAPQSDPPPLTSEQAQAPQSAVHPSTSEPAPQPAVRPSTSEPAPQPAVHPSTGEQAQAPLPLLSAEEAHAHNNVCLRALRLHRVNIIADMLEQFKDASVMDARLSVSFINESGIDASGIARDAYTCFGENFFLNCADGEVEYVPALQPEYGKEEWEAVGRILLKGYKDHGFFPIKLSLAFTVCLIHGESEVATEMLIESFLRFVTPFEKAMIKSALEGREYDTEDLVDMLSRMGAHHSPDQDTIKETILNIAHKQLIQEPMYAMKMMGASSQSALKSLFPTV